jgi:hypothetical protein
MTHEGDPPNQETKNRQLDEAGPTESTQEGDVGVFSTVIAQNLVPYCQLGHHSIHLTSNPDMTSAPQKELLHCIVIQHLLSHDFAA